MVEHQVNGLCLEAAVGDIVSDYCLNCQSWHCKKLPGPESAKGTPLLHASGQAYLTLEG